MRLDAHPQVQISGRAIAATPAALSRQPYPLTVDDTRGNVYPVIAAIYFDLKKSAR